MGSGQTPPDLRLVVFFLRLFLFFLFLKKQDALYFFFYNLVQIHRIILLITLFPVTLPFLAVDTGRTVVRLLVCLICADDDLLFLQPQAILLTFFSYINITITKKGSTEMLPNFANLSLREKNFNFQTKKQHGILCCPYRLRSS